MICGKGFPLAGHFSCSFLPTDNRCGANIELRISLSFSHLGGDAKTQILSTRQWFLRSASYYFMPTLVEEP